MRLVTTIIIALLAAAAPHMYGRISLLVHAHGNRPAVLKHRRLPYTWQIELADQVKNCEHFVLDEESGYAILSCDPSRDTWNAAMGFFKQHDRTNSGIYLWDYANRHSSPGKLTKLKLDIYPLEGVSFHPLGINYHAPSRTLFVANHAKLVNRVEIFDLDIPAGKATFRQTLKDPRLPEPNSMYPVSATEWYITNSHYFTPRHRHLAATAEVYLGLPIGAIVHVDISGPEPVYSTVARHPFPNGIAPLNGTHWAVASSSTGTVRIYEVDASQTPPVWKASGRFEVDMFPDNLSIDSEGVLWCGGHPNSMSLEEVAFSRLECDPPKPGKEDKCSKMSAPSHVISWTEQGGVRDVYVDDEYWAACTAQRDVKAKMGLVSGLYGKGILTWRE